MYPVISTDLEVVGLCKDEDTEGGGEELQAENVAPTQETTTISTYKQVSVVYGINLISGWIHFK